MDIKVAKLVDASSGDVLEEFSTNIELIYKTSEECVATFETLKNKLKLSPKHEKIINRCIESLNVLEGDNTNFSPVNILSLHLMACKYPQMGEELMACAHFMQNSFVFDGEITLGLLKSSVDFGKSADKIFLKPFIGSKCSVSSGSSDEDFSSSCSDD